MISDETITLWNQQRWEETVRLTKVVELWNQQRYDEMVAVQKQLNEIAAKLDVGANPITPLDRQLLDELETFLHAHKPHE